MKKGLISLLVLTASFSACFAQSDVKEVRNVKDFNKVSFGVAGNLYISFGPEFKVVLEGDRDIIEDIITEVSGGKLVIKKDNWRMNFNEKVTVNITMPEIKGLSVSGSGKAEIKDAFKSSEMSLNVSGSGKIFTNEMNIQNLSCSISGSGNINLGNGKAKESSVSISGSGNYSGEEMVLESADISISGSGNCTCNVSENLKARISGSGNVSYLGKANKVDARVSGSGHVRSR
jgi:hypothetical protein